MADPILEQLAQQVVSEVSRVTTENDFSITLAKVVRESRSGPDPEHLLAIVYQDFEEDAAYEEGTTIVTLAVVFTVCVFVMPSDDDQTPLDKLLNQVWADVTRAVTENWDTKTPGTIGGLAYGWSVLAPQLFGRTDGAFDGINCRYRALVRVEEKDPYTQR